MYGTKVPRSIWALSSGPATWLIAIISFYPKPQPEPTQTAVPNFATWPFLCKLFPNTRERIMPKPTIHNMLGSAQETPLSGMLAGVGTKFQGHFHHIPLPPNHPLTTDDIGPTIALTMTIIMIFPLIQNYKYEKLGKRNGCWKVLKKIESREKEWFRKREREKQLCWVSVLRTTRSRKS